MHGGFERLPDQFCRKAKFGLSDGSPFFELTLCSVRPAPPQPAFAHQTAQIKLIHHQVVVSQEKVWPEKGVVKFCGSFKICDGTRTLAIEEDTPRHQHRVIIRVLLDGVRIAIHRSSRVALELIARTEQVRCHGGHARRQHRQSGRG